MSATVHVSDPGTEWTVHDPWELALRIRLRAVHMVARQGPGYLGQGPSAAAGLARRPHAGARLTGLRHGQRRGDGRGPGVGVLPRLTWKECPCHCRSSSRPPLRGVPRSVQGLLPDGAPRAAKLRSRQRAGGGPHLWRKAGWWIFLHTGMWRNIHHPLGLPNEGRPQPTATIRPLPSYMKDIVSRLCSTMLVHSLLSIDGAKRWRAWMCRRDLRSAEGQGWRDGGTTRTACPGGRTSSRRGTALSSALRAASTRRWEHAREEAGA